MRASYYLGGVHHGLVQRDSPVSRRPLFGIDAFPCVARPAKSTSLPPVETAAPSSNFEMNYGNASIFSTSDVSCTIVRNECRFDGASYFVDDLVLGDGARLPLQILSYQVPVDRRINHNTTIAAITIKTQDIVGLPRGKAVIVQVRQRKQPGADRTGAAQSAKLAGAC
jgi:hypothetical protein